MANIDFNDELSVDPDDLRVHEFDVRSAVFILPSDAPIPSELSDVAVPTGSLYQRLAALDVEEHEEFAFVPLAGAELLALDRVWRTIARARRVYALFDIPGAKYDILFTQSVRQIGLQVIEWPAVSQALADRTRQIQRTSDTAAWTLKQDLTGRRPGPKSSTSTLDANPLTPPESSDED